jgi:hypothetical protein
VITKRLIFRRIKLWIYRSCGLSNLKFCPKKEEEEEEEEKESEDLQEWNMR